MSLETHFLQVGSKVREHRVRQLSIMTCSPFGIWTQRLSHSSPGPLCTIKKVGRPGIKSAILPPEKGPALFSQESETICGCSQHCLPCLKMWVNF